MTPLTAVLDPAPRVFVLGTPVGGFSRPVLLTHAGDGSGRMFVVEQGGLIRVVKDGATQKTPFVDARSLLGSTSGEQGLLGLAFHPGFARNGRLFIAYTDKNDDNAVAELHAPPGASVVDVSTVRVLFSLDDPASNHNGGHLLFFDNKLWIGTGDGGRGGDPWNHAQDPSSWFGKMLVVDVDRLPPRGPVRPTIWGIGLRNPWRYAFDADNGDLWIADVGQNEWEEVHLVPAAATRAAGLNFGWRVMEGTRCFSPREGCDARGKELPVHVYAHGADGCSITGGVVKDGRFFFSDFCSGIVWALRRAEGRVYLQRVLESRRRVSSFGVDERGGLWLVDHEGAVIPILRGP